jgi:hypothetical protein
LVDDPGEKDMKQANERIVPTAREKGLVIKSLNDEVLVYDLERDKAHALNQSAAFVWKKCNGRRTVTDIAEAVSKEFKTTPDEQTVWLALEQLSKFNLLNQKIARPAGVPRISRRQMMRIGAAAAFALPVVISIVAPTAANAQTSITQAVCQARRNNNPGGCGGTPCSNAPGTCQNTTGNNCNCVP